MPRKKYKSFLKLLNRLESNEISRTDSDFDADSTLPCPNCGKTDVKVAFGGYKNLETHQASKGCAAQARKNAKPKAKFKSLRDFFAPMAEKNSSTIFSEPPMVHAAPIPQPSTSELPSALSEEQPIM
jgi:hypothetical protein